MDNNEINQCLVMGEFEKSGVLPHLDNLKNISFIFKQDFGLEALPLEPGLIIIRGPRQYGKSTWLESQIAMTIKEFGPGTALYLNCDEIKDYDQLNDEIRILNALFSTSAIVRRLFIDEITAIPNWEKTIKRLIDSGELKNTLLITTGSKATDLRRGIELLPGRKGKLTRTNYIFTPISYKEFIEKCGHIFNTDSLMAYILSGGSPIAINALATTGRIPEYISTIATDWIFGEFAASGRSRSHLISVLQSLYRMAGTPIGQAKLARESGLANNTLAQGYIDLLIDLMAVIPSFHYDDERHISLFRKPCKYHFINLPVALSWHPKKPRTIDGLKMLGEELGIIFEWTVAQEIWRRLCIQGNGDLPEHLNFWQSKEHEIDFVVPAESRFIEVKSGGFNPVNFTWFLKSFPHERLTVINKNSFDTERIKGITLEDFLFSPLYP